MIRINATIYRSVEKIMNQRANIKTDQSLFRKFLDEIGVPPTTHFLVDTHTHALVLLRGNPAVGELTQGVSCTTYILYPIYLLDQHVYSETLDTTAFPAKIPDTMWL